MTKFCFVLGKNPILSTAEILHRTAATGVRYQVVDQTGDVLVIEADGLDPATWQHRLGGTVKIGIIDRDYYTAEKLLSSLTPENLPPPVLPDGDRKLTFGFSLYGPLLRSVHRRVDGIGIALKRSLKSAGRLSRYVRAPDGALTAVQVDKNGMLESGADILLVAGQHAYFRGRTVTVQEYEEYSARDYGRPRSDARSGMIPPKLAKIMINLSGAELDQTILDPFCGSGTILQEAIAMGFRSVVGSDISPKAVDDTKANLSWLTKNFTQPNITARLFLADVRGLSRSIPPATIDAVVTEPYLGPPQSGHSNLTATLASVEELERLYRDAFATFATMLRPNGRVVIIFPLFKNDQGTFSLKILEQLDTTGFSRLNPLPEATFRFARIGPTARGSILYQRPGQRVQREVFIFQRKKS
ncbi:MAG: DNA methyltransferase [Patescibacteria group bacterium]